MKNAPPVVALFAATDPTCGAGLFADIRAVAAQSCAPFAVACGIAPQNLDGVVSARALPARDIREQFAAAKGARFAAMKIGALFSSASVRAVARCVDECRKKSAPAQTPLVWDPVLAPSRGTAFADAAAVAAAIKTILPRATVVTPNYNEAAALINNAFPSRPSHPFRVRRANRAGRMERAAKKLLALGAQHAFVTDSESETVRCVLFGRNESAPLWETECPRRVGDFHGTGCLFAATLAARLARGDRVPDAAERAHRTTLSAVGRAVAVPELGKQKLISPD